VFTSNIEFHKIYIYDKKKNDQKQLVQKEKESTHPRRRHNRLSLV